MSGNRSRDSSPEGSVNSDASQESDRDQPIGTPQGNRSNTPVASPSAHGTEHEHEAPERDSRAVVHNHRHNHRHYYSSQSNPIAAHLNSLAPASRRNSGPALGATAATAASAAAQAAAAAAAQPSASAGDPPSYDQAVNNNDGNRNRNQPEGLGTGSGQRREQAGTWSDWEPMIVVSHGTFINQLRDLGCGRHGQPENPRPRTSPRYSPYRRRQVTYHYRNVNSPRGRTSPRSRYSPRGRFSPRDRSSPRSRSSPRDRYVTRGYRSPRSRHSPPTGRRSPPASDRRSPRNNWSPIAPPPYRSPASRCPNCNLVHLSFAGCRNPAAAAPSDRSAPANADSAANRQFSDNFRRLNIQPSQSAQADSGHNGSSAAATGSTSMPDLETISNTTSASTASTSSDEAAARDLVRQLSAPPNNCSPFNVDLAVGQQIVASGRARLRRHFVGEIIFTRERFPDFTEQEAWDHILARAIASGGYENEPQLLTAWIHAFRKPPRAHFHRLFNLPFRELRFYLIASSPQQ